MVPDPRRRLLIVVWTCVVKMDQEAVLIFLYTKEGLFIESFQVTTKRY